MQHNKENNHSGCGQNRKKIQTRLLRNPSVKKSSWGRRLFPYGVVANTVEHKNLIGQLGIARKVIEMRTKKKGNISLSLSLSFLGSVACIELLMPPPREVSPYNSTTINQESLTVSGGDSCGRHLQGQTDNNVGRTGPLTISRPRNHPESDNFPERWRKYLYKGKK